ncbi:MAG: OmpA family protein [Thermoanaerobaculia bacterium]
MYRRIAGILAVTILLAGCVTSGGPNEKTKKGAGIGAAAGAIAGAIIGNQSGDPRTGAVIGAAVGAGVGAAAGHRMDQQQKELQQIEGVEVTRTADDELNVVMQNNILFDYDSAALRPQSRQTLEQMTSVFTRYPDTDLVVAGHTDSVGSADYNQGLSERRADSVAGYLVDHGVDGHRITAVGYGKSRPVASNDTPEGRQLNRRVEITVHAQPEGN